MKSLISALSVAASIVAVLSAPSGSTPSQGPAVDLGSAGKYIGAVTNNGTVHSWKGESPGYQPAVPHTDHALCAGIRYAQNPTGALRFAPPKPLGNLAGTVTDLSNVTRSNSTSCIQLSSKSAGVLFPGPTVPTGQEDCLKVRTARSSFT